MRTITLVPVGGEPVETRVEIQPESEGWQEFAVSLPGEIVSGARLLSAGGAALRIGSRLLACYTVRRGEELQLWIDGESYRFSQAKEGAVAREAASAGALPAGGVIEAPMPGRILKLLVAPGDRVPAGAPLVIMESMKMELTVAAPGSGVVAELFGEPGAMVERGAALARLEATP